MNAKLDGEFREFMHARWPAMVRLAYGLTGDQGKHCQAQDSRDGTANDQAQRSAAADPGGQLCCGG